MVGRTIEWVEEWVGRWVGREDVPIEIHRVPDVSPINDDKAVDCLGGWVGGWLSWVSSGKVGG